MSGIEELVATTLEAYEAAKAIKEGVVEAWQKLEEAYGYISTYFSVASDAHGRYNDPVKVASLWSEIWVHPMDFKQFLDKLLSTDVSDNVQRALLFSSFHRLQTRPFWPWGYRFPDDTLLPLTGTAYRGDYLGVYVTLNSISLIIKYGNYKDLPAEISNFGNHANSLSKLFAAGIDFTNRERFETFYKLKWFKS